MPMSTFRTSNPVSAADVERASADARPHLILVGLPGSGKTRTGTMVAERLSRPFLDFDAEIERREHQSVGEIFAQRGELVFRALEVRLTQELAAASNMVLAPGGGWIVNPGCLSMLRPPALLIYLQVRPETALARMGGGAWRRPLLNRPDPVGELRKLLEQRETLYLQSDHVILADKMTLAQVVDGIVALARG